MTVHRYVCENGECGRKTFSEKLEFAERYSRRSHSADEMILAEGIGGSDMGTARTLQSMGLTVTRSQTSYLFSKISVEVGGGPGMVGVDDVSGRRGVSYFTVIYGPDGTLLHAYEGRGGDELEDWLREHPTVKVVCRDRATAYSSAASSVVELVQVADRFHMVNGLLEAVNDLIKKEIRRCLYIDRRTGRILKKKPAEVVRAVADDPIDGLSYPLSEHVAPRHETKGGRAKMELALRARKMAASGLGAAEVADALGISAGDAEKYIGMTQDEVEGLRFFGSKTTKTSVWDGVVLAMLRDGRTAGQILRYVSGQENFGGTVASLASRIERLAGGALGQERRRAYRADRMVERTLPEWCERVTKREIAHHILCVDKAKRSKKMEAFEGIILKAFPKLRELAGIFSEGHSALMGGSVDGLHSFIDHHKDRRDEVGSFARGLLRDLPAAESGVTRPESSGFVEGNNNKLKLLKRILYGRAGFVNFSKRLLLYFIPWERLDIPEIARTRVVKIGQWYNEETPESSMEAVA